MSSMKKIEKTGNEKSAASRNVLIAGSIALLFGAWAVAQTGAATYFFMGAPALSPSNLSTSGGKMFETRFEPETFEGDLIARQVDTNGSFPPDTVDGSGAIQVNALWQGKLTTTAQSKRAGSAVDDRVIITSDASGGRRFWWDTTDGDDSALTNEMKALISGTDPGDPSDPIVDWTRGYDDNEGPADPDLRQRNTVMGNPVHGSATYLGAPTALYGNGYSTFRSGLTGREPLVFAGAGDAMMHAFQASDGREVFAYIPSEFLDNLEALTRQDHSETFLADGTPVTGDAYGPFPQCGGGSCWRTVLVSGLGFGGNSVFALDVTNPVDDIANETDAAEKLFLWEFTDNDLGLTTSEPLIGQLNDGTWAAVFGSGQGASAAILYVVDLADGTLIQELPITGTNSGLSSPAGWVGFDDKLDAVYAGDRSGNLWKFDFTSSSASGGVTVAFSGSPLVTVTDPPASGGNPLHISTRPLLTLNPEGPGLIVYFATGSSTQNPTDANGVFGVFDNGSALGLNPSLNVHLLSPIRADGTLVIDPDNFTVDDLNFIYRIVVKTTEGTNAKGWKVQLMNGERVLTNPRLGNGRIYFTSSDAAITDFNRNWFIAVDFLSGGEPTEPFLDVNGDGLFDLENDVFIDVPEECTPNPTDPEGPPDCSLETFDAIPVGRFLDTGVVSAPTPANIANKKDTVFITHGLETVFDVNADPGLEVLLDPGVVYGHFDHDTHVEVVSGPGGKRDHTHEYDDKYDLNGVNMLVSGGNYFGSGDTRPNTFLCGAGVDPTSVEPPCTLLVTGMLSAEKALMDRFDGSDGAPPDGVNTQVLLSVENPHSYDTPQLAQHRCTEYALFVGVDPAVCTDLSSVDPEVIPPEITGVAPPVTLWYQCLDETEFPDGRPDDYRGNLPLGSNSIEFVGSAVEFMELPEENRTCKASHIGILVSKITNINALRIRDAGRDDCEYRIEDLPQDIIDRFYPIESPAYNNSGYRGGSFTVRAQIAGTDIVFHEDTIYEHANAGSIDRDRSAESDVRDDLENPGQGIGECTAFSEWQRAYKDPDYFDGGDEDVIEDPGTEISTLTTVGTQITETIDVSAFDVPQGRVSWRELLK